MSPFPNLWHHIRSKGRTFFWFLVIYVEIEGVGV